MFALYFAQIVNSGLALGSVYGLLALGFALIYNSSRLINFAQGELLLLGGLGLFSLTQALGLPAWLFILLGVGLGFGLGFLLYGTTVGLSFGSHPLRQLMLTVAASLSWQGLAILAWGKKPLLLPQLLPLPALRFGPFFFSENTTSSLTLAVVSGVSLTLYLKHARLGRAIRAVSQNPLAARLQGIPPKTCQAVAFGLSGVLAALAAMAVGPATMLRYDMGFGLGLKGFVAATLGGYSSLSKVFAGGLALGFIEAGLALFLSAELKETVTYGLLILLLVVLPGRGHGTERA